MPSHSLACPWCSTPLRVKDRALVGRVFHCPDCRASIQVVDAGTEGLSIRRAGLAATEEASTKVRAPSRETKAARRPQAESPSGKDREIAARFHAGKRQWSSIAAKGVHWVGMLRDPLVLSWTVAGVFTLVMLFVIKPWGRGAPAVSKVTLSSPDTSIVEQSKPPVPADNMPPPVGAVLLPPENVETEPIVPPLVEERERRPAVVAARPQLPVVAMQPVSIELEASPGTSTKPPEVDVAALLEQPIRRYELTKAVPLSDLLPELKELAAVPIHADVAANPGLADHLARRVSLQLDDTTVGEILRAFAEQAGLDLEIQPDGVHLRVKSPDNLLPEK